MKNDPGLMIFTGVLVLAIVAIAALITVAVNGWTGRRARRLGKKPTEKPKGNPTPPLLWLFLIIFVGVIIFSQARDPARPGGPIPNAGRSTPLRLIVVVGALFALAGAWFAFQYLRLRLRYHD